MKTATKPSNHVSASKLHPTEQTIIANSNAEITAIIMELRKRREDGAADRYADGERFHRLRGECERYGRSNKTRLSYAAAVALTGFAWSTAEKYRAAFELKEEIGGDLYLLLCEHNCNLATFKATLKEAFKGAISPFKDRLSRADLTDPKAVSKLATDLKSALKTPTTTPIASDVEELVQNLETLEAQLSAPTPKSKNETLDLAASIFQVKADLAAASASSMNALVDAVAPFLGWDREKIAGYMEKFSALPLPLQSRTYREAVELLQKLSGGLESLIPDEPEPEPTP